MTRKHTATIAVVILATTVALINPSVGAAQPARQSPATTITPQTPPEQVAAAFIHSLETYLLHQRAKHHNQAKTALKHAADLIAEDRVEQMLSSARIRGLKITPEQYLMIKQAIASTWASVINYYRGHVAEPKPTRPPATQTTRGTTVRILLPANANDGLTRPVNIVVVCVREKTWKVNSLGLIPAPNK